METERVKKKEELSKHHISLQKIYKRQKIGMI